ncbi:MAG: protein phosphatase 2C domain-containing protein [Clostridiales bacterium]|jgi:protein phosphatase|nr:protein phosphatase 2C domain-containing protein [Clostridiales bacterium]
MKNMKIKSEKMRLEIGGISDRGKVRENNEDSIWYAYDNAEVLCIVADGMGGYQKGELSSKAAVDAAERFWKKKQASSNLKQIFHEAHEEIRKKSEAENIKTGTTVSVISFSNYKYLIAHAGDTRIYRLSRGVFSKLTLLTKDDTVVAEELRKGILSKKEAENHPRKHVITNCIGASRNFSVFEAEGSFASKDVFLLCSDGLYGKIRDAELVSILKKCVNSQKTADELLELAMRRGGEDNISAIVVKFS